MIRSEIGSEIFHRLFGLTGVEVSIPLAGSGTPTFPNAIRRFTDYLMQIGSQDASQNPRRRRRIREDPNHGRAHRRHEALPRMRTALLASPADAGVAAASESDMPLGHAGLSGRLRDCDGR